MSDSNRESVIWLMRASCAICTRVCVLYLVFLFCLNLADAGLMCDMYGGCVGVLFGVLFVIFCLPYFSRLGVSREVIVTLASTKTKCLETIVFRSFSSTFYKNI